MGKKIRLAALSSLLASICFVLWIRFFIIVIAPAEGLFLTSNPLVSILIDDLRTIRVEFFILEMGTLIAVVLLMIDAAKSEH